MDYSIELKKCYWIDVKHIPDFIDTKRSLDKSCYELSQNAYDRLSTLFRIQILSLRHIKRVVAEVNIIFLEMTDIDVDLMLLLYDRFHKVINHYLQESIDNEIYEVSSNLSRFMDNLVMIKTISN